MLSSINPTEESNTNMQSRLKLPSNLKAFNSRDNSLDVWTEFNDQNIILKSEVVLDNDLKPAVFNDVVQETAISLSNREEFNTRGSGLEQWAEFDDTDKVVHVRLKKFKAKNENWNANDVMEGKTVKTDKQTTIIKQCGGNTFPYSNIEMINKRNDSLDRLEEIAVLNVEEANKTVLEEDTTTDNQKNLLKCKFCPFLTKDGKLKNGQLRSHMRKFHFVCCICEHKSENKTEAEMHFAKEHEEENNYLRCNIGGCDFREDRTPYLKHIVFKERQQHTMGSGMITHVRSAHQGVWFTCDQCPIRKRLIYELNKHKQIHSVLPRTRKECTICGISLLANRGALADHIRRVHSDKPSLFSSKCKFSSKDRHYLKIHEKGHTELLKCKKCGFSCIQKNAMKRHIQFKHEGGAFLCSSCDFKTDTLNHLQSHEEQHNERTLKCPHCKYMGRGNSTLKKHMLRHEDPKYLCTECDYKTYDRANFSTHKTTKHGNIVHQCESCDYGSKSKRSLRQHKDKHHNSRN